MAKETKEEKSSEDVPNINMPVFPPLDEEQILSEKSYSTLEDEAGTSGGVGAVLVEPTKASKGDE
jgi:hypothetical protein